MRFILAKKKKEMKKNRTDKKWGVYSHTVHFRQFYCRRKLLSRVTYFKASWKIYCVTRTQYKNIESISVALALKSVSKSFKSFHWHNTRDLDHTKMDNFSSLFLSHSKYGEHFVVYSSRLDLCSLKIIPQTPGIGLIATMEFFSLKFIYLCDGLCEIVKTYLLGGKPSYHIPLKWHGKRSYR